ncbi:3-hydroxybutyryl-CoA dehydrogenase [Paenibacillus sp. E194]|uniref:NAD-binding 3-hydroxyacyl-CoA dehydrogenase n=1 Tax=Paenibacillus alvei TS-15 TaxID=1117108 RepID=S9TZZ7_PAEAL|nr:MULTISPECIES: 3-hydroxyacyl-CoA dehydrogenase family protein [Paenibacillus]EPY03890.1 NAD-binding 3-hydroxyacyl-CoA dehydrogenase [Paenibacillus alvei TS-15]KJB84631.1 3-hydroxybutyryl-CoA dehydrogenase [Paenibacillus sp. E194]
MQVIGVIGAGVMGTGVAHNYALAGYDVILVDISEDILTRAKEQISKNIRFQGLYNKDLIVENPETILNRICFTVNYDLLSNADYIIENVPEKWETKKDVYVTLDRICPEHCIFAVNTSCISITKVASLTNRPTKVIGSHYMNPVLMKPVVEVIKGYHTSEETIAATIDLLATLNKEAIVVSDLPGFVSNRVSHLMMNEAAFVVQDQVAEPRDVDDIFKKCFGHKMGPLETADLIGLDTVVHSLDILYESYQDSKFRCCPLLRKMVDAGTHGRKTGQGFYSYQMLERNLVKS